MADGGRASWSGGEDAADADGSGDVGAHARLAGESTLATEQRNEIALGVVLGLEELFTFEDFDLAGAAARRAARKRNGGEVVVTDVDELTTFWSVDALLRPEAVGGKNDRSHARGTIAPAAGCGR